MSSQFTTRLNSLRNAMKAKSFKGFIIPSGDPHLVRYFHLKSENFTSYFKLERIYRTIR